MNPWETLQHPVAVQQVLNDLGGEDDDTEVSAEPHGSPEPAEVEPEQEPELVYPDLVSFVQEKLPRPIGAASAEQTGPGAHPGGNTKKQSAD